MSIQRKIDEHLSSNAVELDCLNKAIDDLALRWENDEGYHYQLTGHTVPKLMPWIGWEHGYKTALSGEKLYNIKQLLESAPEGMCAEFGVYTGGTTRMMLDMGRKVLAFDTFEGIKGAGENDLHTDGDYNGGEVFDYISGAYIFQGMVPESLGCCSCEEIAFAHIDMDVYEPTVHALRWCWERLVKGGVIVLDDYGNITTPGIRKAVDEFKYGAKFYLPTSQIIIRKL